MRGVYSAALESGARRVRAEEVLGKKSGKSTMEKFLPEGGGGESRGKEERDKGL